MWGYGLHRPGSAYGRVAGTCNAVINRRVPLNEGEFLG